jgi:hypothetical protein
MEDFMRRFWKIAGIATMVAVLAVVAAGAIAVAQEPEDADSWPFQFREKLHEAIAGVLGISVDEYDSAVETARDQVLDEAVTSGWLTQDQADRMRERAEEGFGPGMRPGFRGRHGAMPGLGGMHHGLMGGPEGSLLSVAADQLEITVEELLEQLQAGKTIADLASEKGVDLQSIADAHLDSLTNSLNEAVQDGLLTQERADWMLAQARERVLEHLEGTWPDCECHPDNLQDGGMPGGMHGFPSHMWGSSS